MSSRKPAQDPDAGRHPAGRDDLAAGRARTVPGPDRARAVRAWPGAPRDNGLFYAQHGYVVVAQNVRGTFASEGRVHIHSETMAGESTRTGTTPSSGRHSSPGRTAGRHARRLVLWHAAVPGRADPAAPPAGALRTPRDRRHPSRDLSTPVGRLAGTVTRARSRSTASWSRSLAGAPALLSDALDAHPRGAGRADLEQDLWRLPLTSWPAVEGLVDWYWEALDHPEDDAYWQTVSLSRVVDQVDTPILHMSSWFDMFLNGVLRAFAGVRANGRSAACRDGSALDRRPLDARGTSSRGAPVRRGRLRAGGADRPARAATALVRPLAEGRRERRAWTARRCECS